MMKAQLKRWSFFCRKALKKKNKPTDIAKCISAFPKYWAEIWGEKKLLAILVFCAAFTQIHQIAFLFPNSQTWAGLILEHWHSWQTAMGVAFFLGSGILLALFLIIILPRSLPQRYFLPLALIVLVNGAELINIFLDRPYTYESEFFNPWYTLLPLLLIGAFLFRNLIHTAPSEQNRLLRSKIDRLRKEHLVEIFDKIITLKYSSLSIESTHDLQAWKDILKKMSDEGMDEVVMAIKACEI